MDFVDRITRLGMRRACITGRSNWLQELTPFSPEKETLAYSLPS
jgi:hypothetical protein